jgi:hypothetical protein
MLLLTTAARSQTIISTLEKINIAWLSFGEGLNFQTVGQTLVLPQGAKNLDAFEFILQRVGTSGSTSFRTYVMEWNNSTNQAVGTPLYRSGDLFYDNTRAVQRFRLPTGQLNLDPGKQYVAFISTTERSNGIMDRGAAIQVSGYGGAPDAYVPGRVFYQVSGTNFGSITSSPWNPLGGINEDMGFRAFFDMPYHTNLMLGHTPSLSGVFGNAGLASTLTDGAFLPEGTHWQSGTVWWTNPDNEVLFDLGGIHTVSAFNLQADDNDAYIVDWKMNAADPWTTLAIPYNLAGIGGGMRTRPDPGNPGGRLFLPSAIDARYFRIRGDRTSGDGLYSLSEFQVYGVVPEPSTLAVFGAGMLGACLTYRRRKSAARSASPK